MKWTTFVARTIAPVALLWPIAISSLPAAAQTPATEECVTPDAALPASYKPWSNKAALAAASNVDASPDARLAVNAAYAVHLQRASEIDYPTTPEKMGAVDSYGGVFSVTVEEAGTYAVALDSKAWIDMLEGGNVVASTAHSHGPGCTTIRKVVSFELQPGPHVIQIAASANAEMAIMVLRQP